MLGEAIKLIETADIFVVIGTSLNVYPAASLVHYVPEGKPILKVEYPLALLATVMIPFLSNNLFSSDELIF